MLQFLSFTWTLSLTKDMDVTGKTAQGMEWSRAEGRKRPDRPAYERNGDLVIRKTSGQVLQQNNYFNKVFSFVEKRVTWTYCGEEGHFSLLSLQPCWPLFVMHSHLHPFPHSIPTAVSSLHPSLPSQILLLCSLLGVLLPSFISSHDQPNIQHMVSCVRAKEIISTLHLPTPDDHFTWLLHPPHCCLIFYVNRWKTTQGVHKAGSIFPAPFPKDSTHIKQY